MNDLRRRPRGLKQQRCRRHPSQNEEKAGVLADLALDKNSPIPLYYQLVEAIRGQISSNRVKPGEQLPSVRELSEGAGVSHMTARQAVSYLAREGLLEIRPGIG